MLLKNYQLLCLCFFGLGFIACQSEITLKETPHLNEIIIKQKFKVVLPENHSTGYTWTLKGDFDKEMIDHLTTVWHGNEKGVYFNFEAQKTGVCTLNFVSRKYVDTLDFKQFTVKVIPK